MGVPRLLRLALILLAGCGGVASGTHDVADAGLLSDAAATVDGTSSPHAAVDPDADALEDSASRPDATSPLDASDGASPAEASDDGGFIDGGDGSCASFGQSCGPGAPCCQDALLVCAGNRICIIHPQ